MAKNLKFMMNCFFPPRKCLSAHSNIQYSIPIEVSIQIISGAATFKTPNTHTVTINLS